MYFLHFINSRTKNTKSTSMYHFFQQIKREPSCPIRRRMLTELQRSFFSPSRPTDFISNNQSDCFKQFSHFLSECLLLSSLTGHQQVGETRTRCWSEGGTVVVNPVCFVVSVNLSHSPKWSNSPESLESVILHQPHPHRIHGSVPMRTHRCSKCGGFGHITRTLTIK